MDAHRIEVLHVADGDAGVAAVAHHLVLDLLPSGEAPLDQDLADRRGGHPAGHPDQELLLVRRGAAARPAERERRAHHQREADAAREGECLVARASGRGRGHGLADGKEELLERFAILGLLDRR